MGYNLMSALSISAIDKILTVFNGRRHLAIGMLDIEVEMKGSY